MWPDYGPSSLSGLYVWKKRHCFSGVDYTVVDICAEHFSANGVK